MHAFTTRWSFSAASVTSHFQLSALTLESESDTQNPVLQSHGQPTPHSQRVICVTCERPRNTFDSVFARKFCGYVIILSGYYSEVGQ